MNNNDQDQDARVKKQLFSKKSNRNHSPFLKERDSNNSREPSHRASLKKNSLNNQNNNNNNKVIHEKNPTKNIGSNIF
jgi:hypothetical protein